MSTRAGERGMTMVEVTIVVAILAMAVAVVVPALSNVGRAELRTASAKLAGTIRATYDSSALNGVPYRLVLPLDKHVIKVEEGTAGGPKGGAVAGMAALLSGGMRLPPAAESEGKDSSKDGAPKEAPPPAELLALFGDGAAGGGSGGAGSDSGGGGSGDGGSEGIAKFHSAGHDLELGDDVRVLDVWVEGMSKPLLEGTAYLNFYAHGYTDRAIIHLTNEAGDIFSIKVKALTGKTEIVGEYVEVPK